MATKAKAKLFLLWELFPSAPNPPSGFRRGGMLTGVYASRAEAEDMLAKVTDQLEAGTRFFLREIEVEELP